MFCEPWADVVYKVFSSEAPSLLYYSHIPSAIIALLLGIFLLINTRKNIAAKALVAISFVFTFWVIADLFTWTQTHSGLVMFLWSYWFTVLQSIFILGYYFVYSFIKKEDLSIRAKVFSFLSLLPVIILSSSSYALSEFDVIGCNAIENPIMVFYTQIVSLIYIYLIVGLVVKEYKKANNSVEKKRILFSSLGILFFLISFSISTYISTVSNWFQSSPDTFVTDQYGFIGMAVFIALLTYTIVRYQAFHVKLIATQAITFALAILIGSQLLFIQSLVYKIVNAITFILSVLFGYLLTKSVKREIVLRESLEIANNEQETLIHFLSHQIKGFFTKSRNIFATMVDEKESFPAGLHPLLEEGLRSDEQGIKMVGDILNAANLKTGKMTYKKTDFDLYTLIKNIIEENRLNAEKKNLKINFFPAELKDEKEFTVNADNQRMRDVFTNLIQNSINYTMEGGINVSMETAGDKLNVIIKDTGVGLTEDDKEKLFHSGGRGSESLKFNVNSTGYGLYIAKKVVVGHGGDITAESEGRGKGSKFTVTLPLK